MMFIKLKKLYQPKEVINLVAATLSKMWEP